MYRLSAYYFAKLVSEIPALLLQPLTLYFITYWATGLNRSPYFLVAVLTIATGAFLSQVSLFVFLVVWTFFKTSFFFFIKTFILFTIYLVTRYYSDRYFQTKSACLLRNHKDFWYPYWGQGPYKTSNFHDEITRHLAVKGLSYSSSL